MRTALASYPRSGNTWLRLLIEEATGEVSGSAYPGEVLFTSPAAGIVVKTHECVRHLFERSIHLVRNPFDAIESYFHYRIDFEQDRPRWEDHVRTATAGWRRHTMHWLDAPMDVYRLSYEELHAAPFDQLGAVLKWLGRDVPMVRVRLAVGACELHSLRARFEKEGGKFFRRGKVGWGRKRFTAAQRTWVLSELAEPLARLSRESVALVG